MDIPHDHKGGDYVITHTRKQNMLFSMIHLDFWFQDAWGKSEENISRTYIDDTRVVWIIIVGGTPQT